MNQPLLHLDVAAPGDAAPPPDTFEAIASAELVHRSRNLLALVQALADHTLRSARDLDEARTVLADRLRNLARTHEPREQGNRQETSIGRTVERTLRADLGIDDGALLSNGPEVALPFEGARWLSMALHELATNSLKHGALSRIGGMVVVRWWARDAASGRIRFEWRERGGPPIFVPTRQGFGTDLICRSLHAALGGPARTVILPDGIDWLVGDALGAS